MADFHGIETIELTDGVRPIRTARSSVIGLIGTAPDADADAFPLNTPVLLSNQPRRAALLGAAGTLLDSINGIYDQAGASVIIVRVAEGADEDATLANMVGTAAASDGVHAFSGAAAFVGATPRIICAPGWSHQRPGNAANPVIATAKGVAANLRATVVQDGPNTNDADAITAAGEAGSDRVYVVDPFSQVINADGAIITQPSSGRVAGVIARTDNELGFWHSPSNKPINGIVGTARPIGFALSDPNSQAANLNANNVATIVANGGLRLWGNRTTGIDPQWSFLPVRRTADMVYESIEAGHNWAMDRPLSPQLLRDVVDGVNAYLRFLKGQGAIIGGKAWLDAELNTPESLAAGNLYIDFDIEPVGPVNHLAFRAHRNNGYYAELALTT